MKTKKRCRYIQIPDVPMEELRDYVRFLCRVCVVENSLNHDDASCVYHMTQFQQVATVLRLKYPRSIVDRKATHDLARLEAIKWFTDTNTDVLIRESLLKTLELGLPQVDMIEYAANE